jgi:hypothetical protein
VLVVRVVQDLRKCISTFDLDWYSHFQDVVHDDNAGYQEGILQAGVVEPVQQETERVVEASEGQSSKIDKQGSDKTSEGIMSWFTIEAVYMALSFSVIPIVAIL